MTQVTLDNVMQELKRQGQAIRKLQGDNSFYQAAYSEEHEEKEQLQETLLALTTRTKRIIDAELKAKQVDKRRQLGFQVLRVFLEEELPIWTRTSGRDPRGINYHQVATHFPHHTEDTIRRRLSEWKLPHTGTKCKGNCSFCIYGFETPPIKGVDGYFLPNAAEVMAK